MKKTCTEGRRSLHNSSLFSAEEVINNEDLRRQIFLRLPAKSLIRFNLVSKQWFSLISDPEFARDHTRRLSPSSLVPSGLYFYSSITKSHESVSFNNSLVELPIIRLPSLPFLDTVAVARSKITILQSCNGLLFFQFKIARDYDYCVCNPATRKYKILPKRIGQNGHETMSELTLVFDPSVSPHYKVVCLNFCLRYVKTEIYSSDTSQWDMYPLRFNFEIFDQPHGLYWNGSVHWITKYRRRYFLHKYDLENGEIINCDVPRNSRRHNGDTLRYFGESKGHLHLVYINNKWSKKFRIFERHKETFEWSVKYHVRLDRLISKFPKIRMEVCNNKYSKVEYEFSILTVYKGEKEKDSALVLNIPGKIVSYNLHDKSLKVLRELPYDQINDWQRCDDYFRSIGFNFSECLAPV